MLVFPTHDAARNSNIFARSLHSRVVTRGGLVLSCSHLCDLRRLFQSAFPDVRAESLHGHAAVILVDQHDHRYKRTTAAARNGSTKKEPFDTLVCAWSDQEHVIRFRQSMFDSAHSNAMLRASTCISVFDVHHGILKGHPHQAVSISYFATVEEFAGRGYAKLLLTHIKTIAAGLATDMDKETSLIVISVEDKIPLWCSDSMGFLRGGDTARAFAHLNMPDTTSADTRDRYRRMGKLQLF
jgi:ribosomal protein S18 acetylase RimI-like enzyme